ncbi:MAG: hypothetical protein GEU83_14430 [Pseudonocardiaceae bacterium]|nr:hypothetical protein [Pseudonocardiaceae bacterium]
MLAWARDVELVVVVEGGATAEFLGGDRNRSQSYVLVVDRATHHAGSWPDTPADSQTSGQVNDPPQLTDDPPTSYVSSNPLPRSGQGPHRPSRNHRRPRTDWPLWQIPASPAERSAAAATLLARIGLRSRGVVGFKAPQLLKRWWDQGACVAGLLHALDHHPDQPDTTRGDALRSARDPLAVLGHRLAPWQNRLAELPANLHGHRGDYRAEQAARIAARTAAADHRPAAPGSGSTAAAREAARAQLDAALAARDACREVARPIPGRRHHGRLTTR